MPTAFEAFHIIAPEFAEELDATVEAMLVLAPLHINVSAYPAESQPFVTALQAASLLVQHRKSQVGDSSGGTVISEKEGDLSRTYSERGGEKDIYAQQIDKLSLGVFGLGAMTRMG